jgi:hypothetical protein
VCKGSFPFTSQNRNQFIRSKEKSRNKKRKKNSSFEKESGNYERKKTFFYVKHQKTQSEYLHLEEDNLLDFHSTELLAFFVVYFRGGVELFEERERERKK